MKKTVGIILKVVGLVIVLIVLDTLQAKLFNTRPLIKVKENKDGGYVDYINKGLLVNNYVCTDGTDKTYFIGKDYDCSDTVKIKEIVDTSKDIKDFVCNSVLDLFYDDGIFNYYYNCQKNKHVVVRYENGNEETVKEALKNGKITIKDLDDYKIEYTKKGKEPEIDGLKSLLGSYITTEKVEPKEVKLKNIISVSLKNVDYSYAMKDKLGIYMILKTTDKNVINALEKYLDKNYKNYTKLDLENGYLIYVQNSNNDFDLIEDIKPYLK